MDIQNNGYSKNMIIIIKKDNNHIKTKASILTYKNNELQVILNGIEEKKHNIIFDANIDIIIKFNFNNINQDFFGLLLLIYGIRKYHPKSVNLILTYFPYASKDLFSVNDNQKEKLQINTDNGLLTMLQNSGISTIKTYDLGNIYVQNYSNLYIENITKENIFTDEIDFLKKTKKNVSVILLNQDDYNLFKKVLGNRENIHLIFLDEDISLKSKNDQINILNKIKDNNKSLIYIFEKTLIRGNKIYALTNMLAKNLDIKDLNICVTHGIFAHGSYNKFNTLIERYPFINIVTTDSLIGYYKKLEEQNTIIYKLPLIIEENKNEE